MSQPFTHYSDLWAKTRDQFAGKPLQNNTRLFKRADDCFAVRFHATDVVTVFGDGGVVLDTGGWYTMSTKDRIGSYAPVQIRSEKGVWYVVHNAARNRAERKFVKDNNIPDRFVTKTYGGGLYIDHWSLTDDPDYERVVGLAYDIHKHSQETCSVPYFDGIHFTKAGRCTNGISPAKWNAYLKSRDKMAKRIQT